MALPQGKAVGNSFPIDQNSKMKMETSRTIKGEGWALPRPHISYAETALIKHVQKGLLRGQKGNYAKGCSLLICLFGKIRIGQEICKHTWKEPAIYQI